MQLILCLIAILSRFKGEMESESLSLIMRGKIVHTKGKEYSETTAIVFDDGNFFQPHVSPSCVPCGRSGNKEEHVKRK